MFSNKTRIDQDIEEREELKKIRIALISSAISYPLWGVLSRYMAPHAYDPQWQRLTCSLITLAALALTFYWKQTYKHISWFYLVAWMYSYHLLFLYWKNADIAYYTICNLIQFSYVILCFPTKKDAQIYTYTKFAAVVLFAIFVPYKTINPWFYALAVFSIGHYIMTVLTGHFNVVDSLKSAKLIYDQSLSNMLEGVLMLDENGNISSYNKAAKTFLGFNDEIKTALSYKDTSLYLHCVDENLHKFPEGKHPLDLVIKFKEPRVDVIMAIQKEDSRFWLQMNVQPLIHSNNILVSFSDITELKRKELAKNFQNAQKAFDARLTSLFTVAGGMAHEINNPLGVIITRLNSLERQIDNDRLDHVQLKDSIQKTVKASYRISNVIATLLQLSNNESENSTAVKLKEVIDQVIELNRARFRKYDVELIIDEIPDVDLFCRPSQFSQVLLNLLSNSFDAVQTEEYKWVRLSFSMSENKVSILVIDSGKKITDEVRERMMEPFFTTKDVGKGAGLGLSIAQSIVTSHGGSLYLDQEALNTSFIIEMNKV